MIRLYQSKRASGYLPILLLCHDIDFKTFRNTILFKFCQDFIGYCDSTYQSLIREKSIPIEQIRIRQGITYLNDVYLYDSSLSGQVLDKIFKKELDWYNISLISSLDGFCRLRLKVPHLLFEFLLAKRDALLHDPSEGQGVDKVEKFTEGRKIKVFKEKLKEKVLRIDDNPNSEVNYPENFKSVNDFLPYARVDYNACQKLIMTVTRELEIDSSDDFLMEGI